MAFASDALFLLAENCKQMNLTETKTIRLLIVEDHQVTRIGLCTLLGTRTG
jgi:hypothetical protein